MRPLEDVICHCLDEHTIVLILTILAAIGLGIALYNLR